MDKDFPEDYSDLEARIRELEVALREARRWIGDGDMSDGLDREIWTPAFAAVVDLVDVALGASKETSVWPCPNCGGSMTHATDCPVNQGSASDLREDYLHLMRRVRGAHELLSGEFYAEALGELDDALAGSTSRPDNLKHRLCFEGRIRCLNNAR